MQTSLLPNTPKCVPTHAPHVELVKTAPASMNISKRPSLLACFHISVVAGTTTNANVTYTVADNRFYISTSADIVAPTLYCKGNSSVAQPLVENVENMQLTYGTVSAATTATTANVAGYLTAGSFVDATTIALPTDAERWAKVVTVRICVVVRSESLVAPDAASARYLDCSGTVVTTPPDLRLRRAYTTTVVLRNRRL